MDPTDEQKAYLSELAADLVANLSDDAIAALQTDPLDTIQSAHDRRQAFAREILEQRSDRSKMARIALCAAVYVEAVRRATFETAIEHCRHIADHTFRKSIGLA